jgi:spoIIIJ-associated protein
MDWIEVTARSVDDAKELALDRLGVVEDELEYEVMDEPRGGLFGLGRTDARIRARVKPMSRDKPADRRRRTRGGSRDRRPAPSEAHDASGNGSDRAREPAVSGAAAGKAGAGNRRRRRGGAGSSGGRTATRERAERANDHRDEQGETGVNAEPVPVAIQAERATKFAEGLVRAMGFDATVRSEVGEDDVLVRIDGDGLGVLVGPRGATLQAVEELVRAVVQHSSGGHSARVHVDVGGYRERRRAALAEFVTAIAVEVRANGVERALEPMNAPDRKVVHDTVAELEGVSTTSEGEDPRRRVVIRPA